MLDNEKDLETMADFKIGDKVRIIIGSDTDKTGVIVSKGDAPNKIRVNNVDTSKDAARNIIPPPENAIFEVNFLKVKLDETGEEKDFPDDALVRIE